MRAIQRYGNKFQSRKHENQSRLLDRVNTMKSWNNVSIFFIFFSIFSQQHLCDWLEKKRNKLQLHIESLCLHGAWNILSTHIRRYNSATAEKICKASSAMGSQASTVLFSMCIAEWMQGICNFLGCLYTAVKHSLSGSTLHKTLVAKLFQLIITFPLHSLFPICS